MSEKTSHSDNRPQRQAKKHYQGLGDLFMIREDLNIIHKVLYISVVFAGLVLVWYGVWTAVGSIAFLSEPVVAIAVGIVLLLFTGKVKDLI